MNFGYFNGASSDRRDVFLYHQLCQIITPEMVPIVEPHFKHRSIFTTLYLPSDEFIQWLGDNDMDYTIHDIWADGCSLFLIRPTDTQMIMLKLSWDQTLCRC